MKNIAILALVAILFAALASCEKEPEIPLSCKIDNAKIVEKLADYGQIFENPDGGYTPPDSISGFGTAVPPRRLRLKAGSRLLMVTIVERTDLHTWVNARDGMGSFSIILRCNEDDQDVFTVEIDGENFAAHGYWYSNSGVEVDGEIVFVWN